MKFTCPHCKKVSKLNPAALMGGKKSRAKSEAARLNGKRGGRPRKDANQVAHGVVAAAEALTLQSPPPLRVVR